MHEDFGDWQGSMLSRRISFDCELLMLIDALDDPVRESVVKSCSPRQERRRGLAIPLLFHLVPNQTDIDKRLLYALNC